MAALSKKERRLVSCFDHSVVSTLSFFRVAVRS
jgi:hypothetical protein